MAEPDEELSAGEVEVCMDVLTRLLASESNRVAWLMGFLVGSQLGACAADLG